MRERWEEIRRVKERAREQLLAIPGVTGVDIGFKTVDGKTTGTVAILIYVSDKREVPADEALPEEIEGIPTDVVQRSFLLH